MSTIEAVDKTTVKFTLNKPFAPFISYIASPCTMMVCREVVEKDGDLTQRAVGTGPFIFKTSQKDVKFEVVKNPNYFKKGRPERRYRDLAYLYRPGYLGHDVHRQEGGRHRCR